jgi:hypothetical protein
MNFEPRIKSTLNFKSPLTALHCVGILQPLIPYEYMQKKSCVKKIRK